MNNHIMKHVHTLQGKDCIEEKILAVVYTCNLTVAKKILKTFTARSFSSI